MSRWRHSRSGMVGRMPRQRAGSVVGLAPTLVKEAGSVREAAAGVQDVLSAGENEARWSRTGRVNAARDYTVQDRVVGPVRGRGGKTRHSRTSRFLGRLCIHPRSHH